MTQALHSDPLDQISHLVIRASAGSGKTHQLVSRYLRLIAAGAPPATILASTFTRLAAGQIRNRILTALAEAANDETKRVELATRLGVEVISQREVIDLLAHLSRNLHRMQIRTLDSFFASIVRGFAIELGLPLGATLVDETQDAQVRREAVRLMLDERKPQDLVDLLRALIQDRAERGVCETIDRVVTSLHDLYLETTPEPWECVPQRPGRLTPPKVIEAIAHLEACTIGPDRKALHKAWTDDLEQGRARDWRKFIKGGIAGKLARSETAFGRTTIDKSITDAYQPLVGHACAVIVGDIRRQTLATRDLLALFDRHYRAVKNSQHAITFSDLAGAMARAERLGTLDAICFRIDATLRHMLLDEFQDTSIPQWRALEPMVKEIICVAPPERSLFCVGDVKQSIYGWRSAAPEVLDELPRLLRGADGSSAIESATLSKSFRSSPVIMEVVNRVFETLGSNVALDSHRDAQQAWSTGFEHHTTTKDFPGYAELRIMPRTDDDSTARSAARCKAAANLVADLHRANPHMSIAVLTRTNPFVARMLYELGPGRLNIPVTGRGGGPLTDAPAVNAVLDLLRLADHPDDTIAAFNVARSPVGAVVGLAAHDDERQRRHVAETVRRQLLDDGYGSAIARWIADLAPSCDERELVRLAQLAELADAHDPQQPLRTGEFIQQVESTRVPTSQSVPVQVMTIHQSKGLEFDAVILPELESPLVGKNPPVAFERHGETGPISRICCWVNKDARLLLPELQPLFDRYERRAARESLSLLYVAMTRAIRGLYMLIDAPNINKNGSLSSRCLKSAAGILRSALADDDLVPGRVAYAEGDPQWMDRLRASVPVVGTPQRKVDAIRLAKPLHGATRGAQARPASHIDQKFDVRQFMSPSNLDARERGIVIHTLFEQIEWLDDFRLDDEALLAIARTAAPSRSGAWHRAILKDFRTALAHQAIIQSLSHNGVDPRQISVHREHPFARIIDGAVQRGSIDRLVVQHDARGRPESATIIDFKTNAVSAAECPGCAEHYRPQMHAYRDVAAGWLGIDATRVEMALLFVGPGVALSVE